VHSVLPRQGKFSGLFHIGVALDYSIEHESIILFTKKSLEEIHTFIYLGLKIQRLSNGGKGGDRGST
jgi:hypothetical protein